MAKASTAHRARRLIALLGRMKNGSVISLAEMAAEVDSSPAELASDLTTLSMCGIAPYTPWELVPRLHRGRPGRGVRLGPRDARPGPAFARRGRGALGGTLGSGVLG